MNIVPVGASIHLRLSVRRRRADRATNLAERFPYLRCAHGLVKNIDSRPKSRQRAGSPGREREVLALVTEGHSNGRIARALYISPKTASVHVSNILAKRGVSSRTEAATVAHRLGLLRGA